MRLAYLILAHTRPGQLNRLISRLSHNDTDIFVHLDKKAGDEKAFINVPGLGGNTFFIKRRADVKWGAFSMVKATLDSLGEIVEHGAYDYVNLLSGMDYPIKSNRKIMDFFSGHHGREFIYYRTDPSPELPLGGSDRFEYYFDYDGMITNKDEYETEMRARGLRRSFIPGMKPYHGSQWWSLTGACIGYILDRAASDRELVNYYRYTKFPDEQFFQTVVMDSRFAQNVVNDNLRYINWPPGSDRKADDRAAFQPHPKILSHNDFYGLKYSEKLFARKFDETVDTAILDKIDALLLRYRNSRGVLLK